MKRTMEYPGGAIKSEDELRTFEIVWEASRKFNVCRLVKLTGDTGVTRYKLGGEYHWFGYSQHHQGSFLDMNIPLNGYNDWFLFGNEADAIAYRDGRS